MNGRLPKEVYTFRLGREFFAQGCLCEYLTEPLPTRAGGKLLLVHLHVRERAVRKVNSVSSGGQFNRIGRRIVPSPKLVYRVSGPIL